MIVRRDDIIENVLRSTNLESDGPVASHANHDFCSSIQFICLRSVRISTGLRSNIKRNSCAEDELRTCRFGTAASKKARDFEYVQFGYYIRTHEELMIN